MQAFSFDMSIPPPRYVETEHEARQWIERYLQTHKKNGGLGFDTETTGLVRHRDRPVIWSLSDYETRICLPAQFLQLFKTPILENPEVNLDLTNANFDAAMAFNAGVDITKAGELRCTLVQSWLFNENNQGRHGLKDQIRARFNREVPEFEDVFGKIPAAKKGQRRKTTGELIAEAMAVPEKKWKAADYASLDSYNSTALRKDFDEALSAIPMWPGYSLREYYYGVEVPFIKVLIKMERRGFCVEQGYLVELQRPMERRMAEIEYEFARAAGKVVNLNSTNDVRWFFYELCGKVPTKMTSGGKSGNAQPSTDEEVLEEWAGAGDPWAKLLLEHRKISKLHGTYVVGLQEWLDPRSRIHTSLNQTLVTGRLASRDPNLMNIPRSGEGVQFPIREAFIPGFRKVLVVADYEQLEMRLLAHFSGDQKMIDAINNGIDIHCLTVSEMYGIPYEEVNAAKNAEKAYKKGKLKDEFGNLRELTERERDLVDKRQGCKAAGFGIVYGIGGELLAANLTRDGDRLVTPEEGFSLIKKWFAVFPGAKAWIDWVHQDMARTLCVRTILGRYRRFGDLKTMSKRDASRAERQGPNAIIQGSAADIAKSAMLRAENDETLRQLGAEMLMQIHDELVFECPDEPDVITAVKQRVREIMEEPLGSPLRVRLPVEIGHGYSWATAK